MSDQAADETDQRPIEDGLLAGRSLIDGRLVFPMPEGEEAAAYQPVILARRGRLWSWTSQRHRPKGLGIEVEPAPTILIGYVELDGQMMVEGHLLIDDASSLHRGMELELTIETEGEAGSGAIYSYAFRPVAK